MIPQVTDDLPAAIDALPPLRSVIADNGLNARRALGQNFLLDLNVTQRIARAAGDLAGRTVIEIGPGPGGLTRALLRAGGTVIAIERDPRCLAALAPLQALAGDRLTLIEGDARTVDAVSLGTAPRVIVANLPYNVATPLLVSWLGAMEAFESLTLMFQREVADRIVADPGTRDYGRLSVLAQWRSRPSIALTLPARAFTPPPKVDSAVVRFLPAESVSDLPLPAVERVTAAAFGQRRKMLRQSLRGLGLGEGSIEAAGLDPTQRADTVDVAGYLRLAAATLGKQS